LIYQVKTGILSEFIKNGSFRSLQPAGFDAEYGWVVRTGDYGDVREQNFERMVVKILQFKIRWRVL